jgi:hypothetical protein
MSELAELGQIERRLHRRYPIVLGAEYKLLFRGGAQHQGYCRTINISSGGILLAVSGLPPWGSIEVSLRWPILLNDLVPVKLVVHGDIVRSDGECSAVKFSQYDFHTISSRC